MGVPSFVIGSLRISSQDHPPQFVGAPDPDPGLKVEYASGTLRRATPEIVPGSSAMAIEVYTSPNQSWCVTTYVPDERETQILGGTEAHSAAGNTLARTLRTYAEREGLVWLIRFEGELRYPRANGTTGIFYPDVMLIPDLRLGPEEPYDVVSVGRSPALVVEITSKKTAQKDIGPKLAAYAELGVTEYVTFDPRRGKKLALHGYRLVGRHYNEIVPAPGTGLWLETAQLWMRAEPAKSPFDGPLLRLTSRAGQPLLHPEEEAEQRDALEQAYAASLAEIARLRRRVGDSAPEPSA
jgi:Uma2 family endonuclease